MSQEICIEGGGAPQRRQIAWDVSREAADLIGRIADRAIGLLTIPPADQQARTGLVMDLIACHRNGCELDLAGLLTASDFDFIHDIGGIHRHLDRKTGRLTDCFVPRYSAGARRSSTRHREKAARRAAAKGGAS